MQRTLSVRHTKCMLLWSYKVSLDLADVLMAGPRCLDQCGKMLCFVSLLANGAGSRAAGRFSVVEALRHGSVCLSLQCSTALRNLQLFWKFQ